MSDAFSLLNTDDNSLNSYAQNEETTPDSCINGTDDILPQTAVQPDNEVNEFFREPFPAGSFPNGRGYRFEVPRNSQTDSSQWYDYHHGGLMESSELRGNAQRKRESNQEAGGPSSVFPTNTSENLENRSSLPTGPNQQHNNQNDGNQQSGGSPNTMPTNNRENQGNWRRSASNESGNNRKRQRLSTSDRMHIGAAQIIERIEFGNAQLMEIENRRVATEQRKADALDKIAAAIDRYLN